MSSDVMMPWERDGYGFSGPIDILRDTKINNKLVEIDDSNEPRPDIAAVVVLFSRSEGAISQASLEEDVLNVSNDDLQLIRQQNPNLR